MVGSGKEPTESRRCVLYVYVFQLNYSALVRD
jgi:hypothetical protein